MSYIVRKRCIIDFNLNKAKQNKRNLNPPKDLNRILSLWHDHQRHPVGRQSIYSEYKCPYHALGCWFLAVSYLEYTPSFLLLATAPNLWLGWSSAKMHSRLIPSDIRRTLLGLVNLATIWRDCRLTCGTFRSNCKARYSKTCPNVWVMSGQRYDLILRWCIFVMERCEDQYSFQLKHPLPFNGFLLYEIRHRTLMIDWYCPLRNITHQMANLLQQIHPAKTRVRGVVSKHKLFALPDHNCLINFITSLCMLWWRQVKVSISKKARSRLFSRVKPLMPRASNLGLNKAVAALSVLMILKC